MTTRCTVSSEKNVLDTPWAVGHSPVSVADRVGPITPLALASRSSRRVSSSSVSCTLRVCSPRSAASWSEEETTRCREIQGRYGEIWGDIGEVQGRYGPPAARRRPRGHYISLYLTISHYVSLYLTISPAARRRRRGPTRAAQWTAAWRGAWGRAPRGGR